ncbi:MmgE/PrpD family protein [Streptantibioticus cattleyicolor]|uniref:MmgE/PrpD family protein n=1 Tax=Streptantibioticus cattleyicolor (strain ATCC 35852 / DSM 46488 / JCM 4925 / NBRC 14057 / NRRL 8057) TaxID=1003195 RepID=F8JLV7_STREN|nr:MmgE/PrpD family protein [Streptantibioticus cattleyicolor]AEW98235.1 MmgE/PrpD family protein [Streptantibioticus cattleyicolor NRRL 8057 = DSM 46488]CCB72701.1 MmgE/PrpD family protein [Streptantibioticus cattleyicolor NRRL 8057 = DSM 46488]
MTVPPHNTDRTTSPTADLAAFAAHTRYDALPSAVVERLQQCLLDFVGVTALGAREAESSQALRDGVTHLAGRDGGAIVIGQSRRLPTEYAALLNGAHAHSLDFDDTFIGGGLHPGAAVIPAALATAQDTDVSGPGFLTAVAVGYETSCRLGAALGQGAYRRGFHPTAIAGVFGAVAAVGRLRGLDAERLEHAFGLAGSMAAGSMQYLANGGWNKRLHPGLAARNALLAVALASAGVIGAAQAIEGDLGLLAGYSAAPEPAALVAGLGTEWRLTGTGIKPYPSCRLTHGAIDAARRLRDALSGRPLDEGRLTVRISPEAYAIVGAPEDRKVTPVNTVDGQFSVYFQIAAALLDATVTWDSYRRIGDPATRRLASRVSVSADDAITPAGAVLTWHGPDGRDIEARVDEPSGEPGTTLSWELVEAKFDSAAAAVYGAGTRRALAAEIRTLHQAPSLVRLQRLLTAA